MNNKGFTLIELIITIALLAVISIISFVSINGVIEDNRVRNCENLRKSIISAAKEYVSDNRYKLDEISAYRIEENDKNYKINVGVLITKNYLNGKIVNPFGNNEINSSKLIINVILNDNYIVDTVELYKNSIGNSNKYNCDVETWWNGL